MYILVGNKVIVLLNGCLILIFNKDEYNICIKCDDRFDFSLLFMV